MIRFKSIQPIYLSPDMRNIKKKKKKTTVSKKIRQSGLLHINKDDLSLTKLFMHRLLKSEPLLMDIGLYDKKEHSFIYVLNANLFLKI